MGRNRPCRVLFILIALNVESLDPLTGNIFHTFASFSIHNTLDCELRPFFALLVFYVNSFCILDESLHTVYVPP